MLIVVDLVPPLLQELAPTRLRGLVGTMAHRHNSRELCQYAGVKHTVHLAVNKRCHDNTYTWFKRTGTSSPALQQLPSSTHSQLHPFILGLSFCSASSVGQNAQGARLPVHHSCQQHDSQEEMGPEPLRPAQNEGERQLIIFMALYMHM